MLYLRRAEDRFHTDAGWLDSRHTFSFGEHHDPRFDGFRRLRVINDDTVAPGSGFPAHSHRDMDIVSYVVEGALAHEDSLGNGSLIKPGDVQRMTAGVGVQHSEKNAHDGRTRFLQIWLIPDTRGGAPSYEQVHLDVDEKWNKLALVATGKKNETTAKAVALHEDVDVYASVLSKGARVEIPLRPKRYAWIQVVRGAVRMNSIPLAVGDGAAVNEVPSVVVEGETEESEILLFDLA